MKKKLLVFACALTLMFGMAMNVSAADSPSGSSDHSSPSSGATNPAPVAPKTGESNLLVYGIVAAALCTGPAVISRKQLEEYK